MGPPKSRESQIASAQEVDNQHSSESQGSSWPAEQLQEMGFGGKRIQAALSGKQDLPPARQLVLALDELQTDGGNDQPSESTYSCVDNFCEAGVRQEEEKSTSPRHLHGCGAPDSLSAPASRAPPEQFTGVLDALGEKRRHAEDTRWQADRLRSMGFSERRVQATLFRHRDLPPARQVEAALGELTSHDTSDAEDANCDQATSVATDMADMRVEGLSGLGPPMSTAAKFQTAGTAALSALGFGSDDEMTEVPDLNAAFRLVTQSAGGGHASSSFYQPAERTDSPPPQEREPPYTAPTSFYCRPEELGVDFRGTPELDEEIPEKKDDIGDQSAVLRALGFAASDL